MLLYKLNYSKIDLPGYNAKFIFSVAVNTIAETLCDSQIIFTKNFLPYLSIGIAMHPNKYLCINNCNCPRGIPATLSLCFTGLHHESKSVSVQSVTHQKPNGRIRGLSCKGLLYYEEGAL